MLWSCHATLQYFTPLNDLGKRIYLQLMSRKRLQADNSCRHQHVPQKGRTGSSSEHCGLQRALDCLVLCEQAHDSKQEEESSHQGLLCLLFIHQGKPLITTNMSKVSAAEACPSGSSSCCGLYFAARVCT